jgi:inward rectifier potassium channel
MTEQSVGASMEAEYRDLGFGTRVANMSEQRLLNRDGSFNTERRGLGLRASLSLYNSLLTMSWTGFAALLATAYLATNALFAVGYTMAGPGALNGPAGSAFEEQLLQGFFFSVQTLSTIGYGHIAPVGLYANLLVTLESMVGLFGLALATGLVFARFSRPTAKIVYSGNAIIAPYRGKTAFEFRIANQRKTQLIDLEARVMFSRMVNESGRLLRRFYPLTLERDKVMFFPLSWTIVHPIDEDSPFYGITKEECLAADAEVLVLLTGIDEDHSQTVHSRSSYKTDEIVWNAKFEDIFQYAPDHGPIGIDISRIHNVTRLEPASG